MTGTPAKSGVSASRRCPFDGGSCVYPCDKLKDARPLAGLTDNQTASVLDVSAVTWWRYRQGKQRPPRAVCGFLYVLAGHLPWPGWQGSFVNRREQRLYIDEYRFGLDLGDLRAYWWQVRELAVLRRENAALRQQVREGNTGEAPGPAAQRRGSGPLGLVYSGTKLTR